MQDIKINLNVKYKTLTAKTLYAYLNDCKMQVEDIKTVEKSIYLLESR